MCELSIERETPKKEYKHLFVFLFIYGLLPFRFLQAASTCGVHMLEMHVRHLNEVEFHPSLISRMSEANTRAISEDENLVESFSVTSKSYSKA